MVHEQVGTSVYHPARRVEKPSLTSHIPQPAPTMGESHIKTALPHRSLGLHTHPPPRNSGGPQDHHLQQTHDYKEKG